jgi:hypothetical protein
LVVGASVAGVGGGGVLAVVEPPLFWATCCRSRFCETPVSAKFYTDET